MTGIFNRATRTERIIIEKDQKPEYLKLYGESSTWWITKKYHRESGTLRKPARRPTFDGSQFGGGGP
jgi:hypothetical protein